MYILSLWLLYSDGVCIKVVDGSQIRDFALANVVIKMLEQRDLYFNKCEVP